jgi:uncharacterized membrane protein
MTQRYRFGQADRNGWQWRLVRNCSITPRQLAALYASQFVISVAIGTGFWLQGAPLVAPYAVLELVVLGIAFLMYARHATDGERVRLEDGRLEVEIERAGVVIRTVFQRQWVRVQAPATGSSLIEVSGQGQTVLLGRHVRPELRMALAHELASALVLTSRSAG